MRGLLLAVLLLPCAVVADELRISAVMAGNPALEPVSWSVDGGVLGDTRHTQNIKVSAGAHKVCASAQGSKPRCRSAVVRGSGSVVIDLS